jgi:outer membrane protein
MKLAPYYLFLSACMMLAQLNLIAQNIWSLQDCIGYALENNIQIKQQKLKTLVQENQLKKAQWNYAPDLNATFVHSLRTGYSFNEADYNYSDTHKNSGYLNMGTSIPVFKGFGNHNNIKLEQVKLQYNLSEYHEFRNNFILSIAGAYLQILLNKEILEVAKNQLEGTSLQVDKTKQQVDVGNIAKGELMKIVALEANDRLQVIEAENELGLALLSLSQLLELQTHEGFDIFTPEYGSIESYPIPDIIQVYEQAMANLPRIKSAELMLQSKNYELNIARSKAYPELDFEFDINSWYLQTSGGAYQNYLDQARDQGEFVYSLKLQVPIFNKTHVGRDISNAKIGLLDAGYQLDLEKKKLYKQIQQAHADAIAAFNKNKAAIEAVNSNQEAFKYTEQKFNVGLLNSVDYYLAKNELLKAQSDLLISKYEFIFHTKILHFFSGKPFTL